VAGRLRDDGLLCIGAHDSVDALISDVLRDQRQPQLLSHRAREEAAHRVLLPPVSFMIAAIVAPWGRLNIAITLAYLEAARERGVSSRPLLRGLVVKKIGPRSNALFGRENSPIRGVAS
jgi:hypothetical protein